MKDESSIKSEIKKEEYWLKLPKNIPTDSQPLTDPSININITYGDGSICRNRKAWASFNREPPPRDDELADLEEPYYLRSKPKPSVNTDKSMNKQSDCEAVTTENTNKLPAAITQPDSEPDTITTEKPQEMPNNTENMNHTRKDSDTVHTENTENIMKPSDNNHAMLPNTEGQANTTKSVSRNNNQTDTEDKQETITTQKIDKMETVIT